MMKRSAHIVLVIMLSVLPVFTGCFEGEDNPDGDIVDGDTVDGDITDGDTDGNSGNAAFSFEVAPGTLSVYFQSQLDEYTEYPANTFAWDFGDGETGSGHSINHEYAIPGSYTVKLTVTLDGDSHSSSQDVLITGFGVVKWKFEFEDTQWGIESGNGSAALAADGTIYTLVTPAGGARNIYSIAPDGSKNWKFTDFDYEQRGTCADPVFSDLTNTLYVVCSVFGDNSSYFSFVTAISAAGQKLWTTVVPDEQVVAPWAIALRPLRENNTDRLYLGTGVMQELKASVYVVSSGGGISKSSFEADTSIIGMAFGPGDSLHIVQQNGDLDVVSADFSALWSYPQPSGVTLKGYMAIDAQGRVFLPLENPPSLLALHNDPSSSEKLLWSYATTGDPGPPSIAADNTVYILERSFGIRAVNPADGSLVWEASQYAYTSTMGIAVLQDGTLLVETDNAQVSYSSDGQRLFWGPPALMKGVAAVAADGTYYMYGRRDHDTVYSDALYAVYGPSPLQSGWTRHRADNANTARMSSGQK